MRGFLLGRTIELVLISCSTKMAISVCVSITVLLEGMLSVSKWLKESPGCLILRKAVLIHIDGPWLIGSRFIFWNLKENIKKATSFC